MPSKLRHVLIVDLNNFARYPSLSVGYLAAVLRQAGHRVSVFSPLMIGIGGVVREAPTPWYGLMVERLNYRLATMRSERLRRFRDLLGRVRKGSGLNGQAQTVAREFCRLVLVDRPDAVLMSSYLMYRPHVEAMCLMCEELGIPAIVGGPYFAAPEVAEPWIDIPGQLGIVGGELELELPGIVGAMTNGRDMSKYPGLWRRDGGGRLCGEATPPLRRLDEVPVPDFADFPWDTYPNRIVPVLTGRGCGWGQCTFCSDVTSTAGRTYRSRDAVAVLDEIRQQHERYGAKLFVFTDLKLNSDLRVWRAILGGMQDAAPGSRWIGAVHVNASGDHGMGADDLKAAYASGCVRLTTGLESGSQRMLDLMKKGADLPTTSRFLRDAAAAGISMRCTMILGYPGEQAPDVRATDTFLREHHDAIERVSLNRFQIMSGTPIEHALREHPQDFPQLTQITINHEVAQVGHHLQVTEDRGYRKAVMRLLESVHAINRKPLREQAQDFIGVM